MRQKVFNLKHVMFLLLVVLFVCCGSKKDVFAKVQYKVVFANAKGEISTDIYRNWAQTVDAGTVIKLPEFERAGYRTYWVLKDETGTHKYLPGADLTVNSNMKLCLNFYKLYDVKFYTANGKKEFVNLRQKACVGEYVTLPRVPSSETLKGTSWVVSTNTSIKRNAGTRYKISGNTKFIGVFQKTYTVNLKTQNGGNYRSYTVASSKTLKFPAINMNNGDVCLGWSTKKGQNKQPEYYTGDVIPKKNANYYMVVFKMENDRAPSVIREPEKYDKVYFLGDSRTYYMQECMKGVTPNEVSFICKGNQGLAWLKSTAYKQLLNDVRKQAKRKKKAVIFNLGVNDLGNVYNYRTYMKNMAKTLKSYNCDMYFMSVNPVNSAMIKKAGLRMRTEQQVDRFNSIIYNSLCKGSQKSYTYINTCTNLKKYGWISNRYNIVDGLHYSKNTTMRIYDYCIRYLNR